MNIVTSFLLVSWMELSHAGILYVQNNETIIPEPDNIITTVDIYDHMFISFDITLHTLPINSNYFNLFQIGNDSSSTFNHYPAVYINNISFMFSFTNNTNVNTQVIHTVTLNTSTPYTIVIDYTQSMCSIKLNGSIIYNDTSFDTHSTPLSVPLLINAPYLNRTFSDYSVAELLLTSNSFKMNRTEFLTTNCDLASTNFDEDMSCTSDMTYYDQDGTLTVYNTFNITDSSSFDSYCDNPRITYTFVENDFDSLDEYINVYEGSTLLETCGNNGVYQSCVTKTCANLSMISLSADYSQSNTVDITVFVPATVDGIEPNAPYNEICVGGNQLQSTLTLFCQRKASTTSFGDCLSSDSSDIEGWYDATSIDIDNDLWRDKSSNQNHATINSNVGIGVFDGTNETHELFTWFNQSAVYGTTDTQITFNVSLHPTIHTVFNYCKYRDGGSKNRILQTNVDNGCFGFWGGLSGQAYEGERITDLVTDYFGTEWVLSSQQHNVYRGNRMGLTDNEPLTEFTVYNNLQINLGAFPLKVSDFACTEIIVINQKLTLDEMLCVENYLSERYSSNAPTTNPTNTPSAAPTDLTIEPSAPSVSPTDATIEPTQYPTIITMEPTTAEPSPAPTYYWGNFENCTSTCTSTKWIEIAREEVDTMGSDVFRYLNFSDMYSQYSICNILKYKIEWEYNINTSYQHELIFKLADSHKYHHIFEDSISSVDPFINIIILSSTEPLLVPTANPENPDYFCKQCSSVVATKPGDSCWAITYGDDTQRDCGCNSGAWFGAGLHYGGNDVGECNLCTCSGGAFAGYTANGAIKGGIASKGLRISAQVCDNLEWQHEIIMNNVSVWRECPEGYVISGVYTCNQTDTNCTENIKCSTPLYPQTIAQSCYEYDISTANESECDPGYFMRGIMTYSETCLVDCMEAFRCCAFDENIIEYDNVSVIEDWSSCTQSNWCDVNTNEYITGITYDNGLNEAMTRHLTWSMIRIRANCDHYIKGIYYKAYGDNTWNLLSLDSQEAYPTNDWSVTQSTSIPYYIAANCATIKIECQNYGDLNAGGIALSIEDIYNRSNVIVTDSNSMGRYYLINTTSSHHTLQVIQDAPANANWGTGITPNDAKWTWTCTPVHGWNCGSDIFTAVGFHSCTSSPTTYPTAQPTIEPTFVPTQNPSQQPTFVPTINPTTEPTTQPTTNPTFIPTRNPSSQPTINPTAEPTTQPTVEPTFVPTKPPTYVPTAIPTSNPITMDPTSIPTQEPSVEPTIEPTSNPTLFTPIRRNFVLALFGDFDALQEYLNRTNSSMAVWARGVIQIMIDVMIHPQFANVIVSINNVGRGSIMIDYSLEVNTVIILDLAEKVINDTIEVQADGNFTLPVISNSFYTLNPTQNPTDLPTINPTLQPTTYPTPNPTTSRPTEADQPVFNVSFPADGAPLSSLTFLGDPYGRFQASINVSVVDKDNVLGVSALCTTCFIWQYRLQNAAWIDIDDSNDDDISVYNKQVIHNGAITKYQSQLTIQSIRRLNAGRCVDDTQNARIFEPGHNYELRLKFVVDDEYFVSAISDILSIETNSLPFGGVCIIENLHNLKPLQAYNLFCDGWNDANNLEYNALLKDVPLNSKTYTNDAQQLTSIAPVGNITITVLIKEMNVSNAITCYPIHAVFRGIDNTSDINALLNDVASLTNSTSFADNPDAAISVITVIEDIYAHNLTTKSEAAHIVDDIVGNIMDGSGILDIVINVGNDSGNVSWVVLDGADIITELSTIASITSNADIVGLESTTAALVNTYLPLIFEAIDVFIDVSGADSSAFLYTISEQMHELINNLESTMQDTLASLRMDIGSVSDEVLDRMNNLAQSLVEYATEAAAKALTRSNVGESYNYDKIEYNDDDGSIRHKKSIVATKFDADIVDYNDSSIAKILPKCGKSQQNMQLPLSFMQQQNGEFDCALMASTRNNFLSKQTNRSQQSETVSIDLFEPKSGSRRRLIEYESNACFPYLITMALSDANVEYNLDMTLKEKVDFPSCDFWNTGSTEWDTSGCFVYRITNSSITCGCLHLTTFSLSGADFLPEANILDKLDVKRLTIKNLMKYPTVWITIFSILTLFLIICCINPRANLQSKHILAFEDIIYKSFQEEVLYDDIVGYEIKYISDYLPNQHFAGYGIKRIASSREAKKSICQLQWKLFTAYLRNEHTFLSVFQRTAGTNFSVKQRLGCFFMYLCNIMMVTGTFYGIAQSNPTKDIIASVIISLSGTVPVTIVKKFFIQSKPSGTVTSVKHKFLDDEDEDEENAKPDTNNKATADEGGDPAPKWKKFNMSAFVSDIEEHNLTMSEFDSKLAEYYDKNKKEDKIRAMSEIRKILFDKLFPLPYIFKRVGWIVLIVWTSAAIIIAMVYGLSFDMESVAETNPNNPNLALYESDCWNTTLSLQIESRLSQEQFLKAFLEQQTQNEASYAGSDSQSWLLSIFQSLFQSMLLWQPLTAYVITWIKVWLFTWNLKMKLGPGNIRSLMKRCCCKSKSSQNGDKDNESNEPEAIGRVRSSSATDANVANESYRSKQVVYHEDRPFDLISFLGNSTWMIDDLEEEAQIVKQQSGDDINEIELQAIATTTKGEEAEDESEVEAGRTGLIRAETDNMDILVDAVLASKEDEEKGVKRHTHQATNTLDHLDAIVNELAGDEDVLEMMDTFRDDSDLDLEAVLDDVDGENNGP